jgi:hypothetical protein
MFTLNQFIVWKSVPNPDGGKPLKVPVNYMTGTNCSAHDAQNWTTFENATSMSTLLGPEHSVGFVLTPNDPYVCIDLDECLQPDGTWSEFASGMMGLFPDALIELSFTGNGLHLWFTADAPPNHKTRSASVPGLEVYSTGRFIALGSHTFRGNPNSNGTLKLLEVLNYYLPGTTAGGTDWTHEPIEAWRGPADDGELIARMRRSRPSADSVFDGKATLVDLWDCNAEVLSQTYPSDTGDDFNHSSADAALFMHLAFWTGNDCDRMDRLFRQSALMREKYENRDDYRYETITKACGLNGGKVYYDPKSKAPPPPPATTAEVGKDSRPEEVAATGVVRSGSPYLTVNQQLEYFKGCIYIEENHEILTPKGAMLGPARFRSSWGGKEFAMTADGIKTSMNAWEVFTESRGVWFPQADGVRFLPLKPPGHLDTDDGRKVVNTYVPAKIQRKKGDVTPFLTHLTKLFHIDRDRAIILNYMAAVAQHIGVKFMWAPVIQGLEGNGKTFLFRCVQHSVGRHYTYLPNAADIANKFNSWLRRKLFIGVEEIYVKDKREVADALKPLIASDTIEIQAKGADQVMEDNMANFMLSSNHKDAIWKTKTDRRYAVFFTPQQNAGDLERDEMNGRYFPDLYGWANNGGYAMIAEYLLTFPIADELNPAGLCHRAPTTSSTEEALTLSTGGIEQEINEAIAQGRKGFLGGWLSSTALSKLIDDMRMTRSIRLHTRREMIKEMGYIPHPGLPGGRATAPIMQEGSNRPTLFVKRGHVATQITSHSDVVLAYLRAQGWDVGEMQSPPIVSNRG